MAFFLYVLFFSSLSFLQIHGYTPPFNNQDAQKYIVYMGSSTSGSSTTTATTSRVEDNEASAELLAHLNLLSSIIPSVENHRVSLIHCYKNAFKGFSAMLTEEEALLLSDHEEIVSVFRDPILQLHTTRSWDFLEDISDYFKSIDSSGFRVDNQHMNVSGDIIIGVIDTGIWPESPCFNDNGIGEIPSRWKGVCTEGFDFKKSHCNRKLIGARYYSNGEAEQGSNRTDSPRDPMGHGTHTASIAGGAMVKNANYFGLARGTAKGGYPLSRLAIYKTCSTDGCSGAAILKAIDDAIEDGVDIISISIGMTSDRGLEFLNDPIAIGSFHASQKGVMVVCSAGNDGPLPYTLVNSAPWIFTVGASSIDRAFETTIVLGNNKSFQGFGINFSNLSRSQFYPLVFGRDVAANSSLVSEASNCSPGSLDPKKSKGKIILCIDTDPMLPRRIKKLVAEDAQARGLILIGETAYRVPFESDVFPFSQVGNVAGAQILKYFKFTKNPKATILRSVDVPKFKPAPSVAYFSSRGPGALTESILKPDITAPGVGILAAMRPKDEKESIPIGKKPSKFGIRSGTSMSCPHVAGAAAFIKSIHRGWSPSMIKSALMTTAVICDNMGKPIRNSSNAFASPHEMGAGEISPERALHPGLVYETKSPDYIKFLCYYGYKSKILNSLVGRKVNCPRKSSKDLISNLNYPSISISKLQVSRTITRTVTNVGPKNSTYIVKVHSPTGLVVRVSPMRLEFVRGCRKASFNVSFVQKGARKGYNFGSLTWSDGTHFVRTVFAVNVV